MNILDRIKNDMYAAMKSGDREVSQTLRTLMAKLKDFQINKNKLITDHDGIGIIKTLVKQRREALEIYENADRLDLAGKERIELDILSSYLPEMMSEEDIKSLVKQIITEVGAKSMSDVGAVMQLVMQRGGEKVDGKKANLILRDLLE